MKVLRVIITAMIALAVVVNVTVASPTGDDIQKVVNSFVEHIDGLESVEADKKSRAQKVIGEVGKDSPDAITEGLIHLYPAYSQAIEMSDAEETDQAIDSLQELSQSNDKYLSADASFYLARTLMNAERFEEALPILQQLTGKLGQFSVHQGNSQYFIGVAQAGLLKNQDAIQSFMTFLSFNPDAPERLRVSAWRQAQELQSIQDGKLDDIYQRMDYSRRRLTLKETGDQTQGEQDKIVDLLTKLIKEEEKKECSSNCKKGGTWQASKQASGQKQNQDQQQQSQSEKSKKGGSSNNANGKVVKNYEDLPASPWSRLRDRQRDPANNAVKEKLPARYRNIIEKYIEAANGTQN